MDDPREESQNPVKETKAEKKAKLERDHLKFLANEARIQNEFWDKLSLRVTVDSFYSSPLLTFVNLHRILKKRWREGGVEGKGVGV